MQPTSLPLSLFLLPSPPACSSLPPSHWQVKTAANVTGVTTYCSAPGGGPTRGFQETWAALGRFEHKQGHTTQGKSLGGGGWHWFTSKGNKGDLCPSCWAASLIPFVCTVKSVGLSPTLMSWPQQKAQWQVAEQDGTCQLPAIVRARRCPMGGNVSPDSHGQPHCRATTSIIPKGQSNKNSLK